MTELDVEALEAATDAVRARNMFTLDGAIAQGIREYLDRTSTHPAPQPSGPVEVKPLEWEERVGVDGTFDAYTSIGHYIATITDDDRGMWFAVGLTQSNYCAPDIDIAKAAAQADYERRIISVLTAGKPEQVPSGWQPMGTAPQDGTRILAVLYREACEDMDGIRRKAFAEVREIFYQPYTQLGMFLPWHAGDPFDSHEGMAPDHFGEAVPIAWLPRTVLPAAPTAGGGDAG